VGTVNVRELARNTSKVIDNVAKRRRSTLITRAGRPVAALVPIDTDALEDWILASSPKVVDGLRLADEELRRGETVWVDPQGGRAPARPKRRPRARR
jgi:prevent-host-death family protein